MKNNCWDIMKCNAQNTCPAAREGRLNGTHDGKNAGRACWVVSGTLCGGEVQGEFAKKYKNCKECEVYTSIQKEEYPNFQLVSTLMNKLR